MSFKTFAGRIVGRLAIWLLKLVRCTNPDRAADFTARIMRTVGPWLSEHHTGRANLARAYPEKSAAEIERILRDVWDNLGRVAAEYAHLDRLWDYKLGQPSRIEIPQSSIDRFQQLRDAGKPALMFAAHLGNWELPAVAAAAHGLHAAILYRRPNIGEVADAVNAIRAVSMGTLVSSDSNATFKLAIALERGTHVGMLVDQRFSRARGAAVTFFGQQCKANPLLAKLARQYECPIHGTRVIRLPGKRFRIELTEAVPPARDAAGRIDVAATMQIITSMIEGWIREYPEQWLWLHRRW